MKKLILVLLGTMILLTSGCVVQTVTKEQAFPEMYKEKPVAILVLPEINQFTAADATIMY